MFILREQLILVYEPLEADMYEFVYFVKKKKWIWNFISEYYKIKKFAHMISVKDYIDGLIRNKSNSTS